MGTIAPFQGLKYSGDWIPRALPWADLFGPHSVCFTSEHRNISSSSILSFWFSSEKVGEQDVK